MTQSYGSHDSVICESWLSHMCVMTQSYGSLIQVQPIAFGVSLLQFQNWNRWCSSPRLLCRIPLKRDQLAWVADLYRKRALYHSKRDLRNIKKDQLVWDVGECDRTTLQFDVYRKRSLYQSKRDLRNIKRDQLEWDGRVFLIDTAKDPSTSGASRTHTNKHMHTHAHTHTQAHLIGVTRQLGISWPRAGRSLARTHTHAHTHTHARAHTHTHTNFYVLRKPKCY